MCPNAALYGEMGWKPVNRTIEEVVLKYWFRLCNLQVDRVTRSVFRWSSYLAEEGYCNWAKRTQGLLGLVTECLDGPLPGNLTEFSGTIRECLLEMEFGKWMNDVTCIPRNSDSGGRLVLYRMFKEEPLAEEYIAKMTRIKKHFQKMHKDVGMGMPNSIKTSCVDGITQQGRDDGV